MKQDPPITYSSPIRGGHLIPGGCDPPAQKRIRPEEVDARYPLHGRCRARAYGRSTPPSSPGVSPELNPMSLSAIKLSDDRR
jgi:hypothetical protein